MALPPEPRITGPYGAPAPSVGPGRAVPGAVPAKPPSAAGYWIATAIIVVGAVVALVWFISGISNLFSAVDTYPRFSVPGQITTPLEAERYKIFAEYPGATTDVNGVFRVGDVTVTDSTGRAVPVSSSYSEETYSWHGHEGRSIAEFTAPTAGTYTIEATMPPTRSTTSVRVAIGRGLQPSAIVPLFAAAGLGGLAVLVGIVLIVVTAVRRGRAKRRAHPVPAFAGVHPAAYPGAYPSVAHPGPAGVTVGGGASYGQWAPPTAPPWGAPGAPDPAPGGGTAAPPPTGAPMPPPSGYAPPPASPAAAPPGPRVPTTAPVSPPVQAPETPPIVPPGWGAAPGSAPAAEPADPDGPPTDRPDADRR